MSDTKQTKPQYVKKEGGEESKTSHRGGYRGGRGGRGGAGAAEGESRPKTTPAGGQERRGERGDKPLYQKRKEGGEERKAGEEGAEKKPRKEQDKDSWVYKYHYAERPKYERVEVTLETEVTAPIAKEDRKKNPDRTEFDDKMRKLDGQIEAGRNKITLLINKKRETIEGGKMKGSTVTFRDFIGGKIEESKALRASKKQLEQQRDSVTSKIDALVAERDTL